LNPRTWVPEASMLTTIDHRSRSLDITQTQKSINLFQTTRRYVPNGSSLIY
jgi:hypothetical protein